MTEPIDLERPLGALVRENPAFARVFESVGLDFCCGGDRTLRTACTEADLDLDAVREQLYEARRQSGDSGDKWKSMTALIEHVVDSHHQYLCEELSALKQLAEEVRSVHVEEHSELADIEQEVLELAEEMRQHTTEEEQDVFPIIEKLDRGTELTDEERAVLDEALADLESDHEATAEHLERIAELSDGYAVPDDACPSYQSLLERLETLEQDTHMHVHKENNVLFPQVESQLAGQA
ncbi:iron-sulfur cluster repair di-iron protein [Haloarcula sp. H-GB4]|uniref:iron-sulfur cluster repair di-iron protein n=1 Tax=Haloarcula sp. H-GB4 TaxID=3069755 RepID=UPI0027B22D9C|nr:iron-sulfur cluster repair di-iron protein [Haloarcula sp. H-GB4]MDQ2074316.1 iron-sulfur cluster repair di-iron protein [Haloarcula sp. H-GB4]